MQVMLMRLMSKSEYVIVPKGTKFTGSGKQDLDFDANQRIDSRRDSRHTIAARIKVDSRERYHD